MSTAKGNVVPSGLVIMIVGVPNSLVIVDGVPNALAIACAASELTTERFAPIPNRISEGGGTRNIRKAKENARCRKVCGLKRISSKPAMNIGRANMWYSKGWKV